MYLQLKQQQQKFDEMEAAVPQNHNLVTKLLKESKDKSGHSLFDHLSLLISQLPLNPKQINNFQQFEALSDFIKKYRFHFKEPLTHQQITQLVKADLSVKNPWVLSSTQLKQETSKIKSMPTLLVSNLPTQAALLETAGTGFDRVATTQIYQSIKKLAYNNSCTYIRFWGRILCRENDYFVVQGISTKKNNTQITPGMEKVGEGINYYTYWVTHNYLEEWHQLPLITPQHFQLAKQIKYIFTGDLNAHIVSYPKFAGQEKHLLKAQLARITHTCQIVPKGLYAATEQNPDNIDFAEEFKYPEFTELANLENWVHFNPYILQQGRCSYYVDPALPEEAKEQQMTEMTEKDPKQDRLKGINEDKGRAEGEPNWLVKVQGDTQVFNNVGKEEGTTSCYAITTLKNYDWPGWLTVSNSKMFTSIYIGYGLKAQQPPFTPFGPNNLLEEGEDVEEYPEPNPKDPPDELEPDSDDDKKKEEQAG